MPAIDEIDGPALERRVIETWQQAMTLEHVSPEDDFYDLGGTSLLAFEIASRLVADFDLPADEEDILAGELLAMATPRAFAARLLEYRSER
jgi:acyl carrier protein